MEWYRIWTCESNLTLFEKLKFQQNLPEMPEQTYWFQIKHLG